MKDLVSISLLLFFFKVSFAQRIAISADQTNILYIGLENPLTIVVENSDCKSLTVKSSNGKIKGANCQFIYKSDTASFYENNHKTTKIEIYKRNKLIGYSWMTLRYVPDPKVGFASRYDGDSIRSRLEFISSNHMYLSALVEPFPLHIEFKVDSFIVSIIRADKLVVENIPNKGASFSKEVIEVFKKLENNDYIFFSEIYVSGSDGTHRKSKSFKIKLSEFK